MEYTHAVRRNNYNSRVAGRPCCQPTVNMTVLIDLEARKDGGCADTEREDVGDRGDGDCDSGVLIGRRLNNISCSCVKL